ncbi:cupredoxin domain-containing protein [Phenylobacterium sp.]|uniref:cupredoxin domain-containing protein n=1 Tax=Phenylobacterium sp. TaxID=1871053 RepID=UPI00286A24A8|nr:cupredoxin domain-containing protein [Phenylobacterium sp.]
MTLVLAASLAAPPALAVPPTRDAAEAVDVVLTLRGHRFTPSSVTVPAGRLIRIDLINLDAASEEFDSEDLRVERDVTPHGRARFTVGPLKPGTYRFMGELHADTASGELLAVETP